MEVTVVKGVLSLVILLTISPTSHAKTIKNAVLLLADDAAFEMGAYLNKICQTPHLDALAKKGLLFNNAFTSVSSCSPSRAQLLTGLTSHQSGMYGLHQGEHHFNVFDTVESLPNILRTHNVFTGLIGKKHVGPYANFKFDYEQTEENHSINQVGRNITKIKLFVREFLQLAKNSGKPFLLMVAFHDPHRCGHITPQYGEFCERWGSGEIDMGTIPDWTPIYYDWQNIPYPAYLPDTEIVRRELAAQYQTISRLDQGVGLVLKEVDNAGYTENSLVIYTSDNGPPFPGGRTNLYDPGVREPMIVSSPEKEARHNQITYAMTSLLDVFPTILDYFGVPKNDSSVYLGKSLLPLLKSEHYADEDAVVYGSQNFHEITMNYPMRMIRTNRFKLIHNLNYRSIFSIDKDLYTSPTFQEILNSTILERNLPWYKTLQTYYDRPEWEMYDLKLDPLEARNIANKSGVKDIREKLQKKLREMQVATNDPWMCAPHGVLQDQGPYKGNPTCFTLGDSVKEYFWF